jgi:hypothetical protein
LGTVQVEVPVSKVHAVVVLEVIEQLLCAAWTGLAP